MANSSNLAFCLEYSQHESDMLETFYDYLRNESLVDVMLSCDGNIIKAHKMVLSAGSPYFRNIFGNYDAVCRVPISCHCNYLADAIKSPWQVPVIVIKDMPFRDLKAIVEFLYRGEVVVPMEQVESLNKSAQTLFIKGLEKYFNNSARVNVDRNNAQTRPENRGLSPKKAGTARTQTTATSFRTTAQRPEPNPQTIAQTTSRSQTSVSSMNNQKPQPPINTNAKNTPKQKPKPANSSANSTPTISMRLRKNRRPDYRQLSNGDFSSDDDSIHEIIMNCPEISPKFQNSVRTYSKTNPILKREIRLKEDREQMCDDEEEDINEAMMINRGHTNIASVQNSIDSQMATTSRIFAPNVPRVTTGIGLPTSSRYVILILKASDPILIILHSND